MEDRYVAAQTLFNEKGIENDDLKEWRELNTRWYQFGCFAPLFRAHGQWPFREVFNIACGGRVALQACEAGAGEEEHSFVGVYAALSVVYRFCIHQRGVRDISARSTMHITLKPANSSGRR